MKELSIEEKARRYDEAIERAKEKQTAYKKLFGDEYNGEDIIYIFPELKESEDEMILRELLNYHKAAAEGKVEILPDIRHDVIVAWLEKQGEKTNPYSGISFEYNGHIWGMCARDNGVDILLDKQLFKHLDEKQDEQNPTDKIIERARTEKQRVLLTETNGDAHIDWDCRSLQDVKLLLKYGLEYIDDEQKKKHNEIYESIKEKSYKEGVEDGILIGTKTQKSADNIIEEEKPLLEKFKQAVYDCAWEKVTCKKEGETKEEYANRWAEHFLLMVRDWADDYIEFTIQQKLRNCFEKGKTKTDIIEKQLRDTDVKLKT